MNSLMFPKVQTLSEDFSILNTLAGFLYSVNSPMLKKVEDSMESISIFMFVKSLPCVDSLVQSVLTLGEGLFLHSSHKIGFLDK